MHDKLRPVHVDDPTCECVMAHGKEFAPSTLRPSPAWRKPQRERDLRAVHLRGTTASTMVREYWKKTLHQSFEKIRSTS